MPAPDIYGQPITEGYSNPDAELYKIPLCQASAGCLDTYFAKPEGDESKIKDVLYIVHGAARNPLEYLQWWVNSSGYPADEVLVIALDFNEEIFPSSDEFQAGDVLDAQGNLLPPVFNAFNWIEVSFAKFQALFPELGVKVYDIWGHGGGAQFVHRFLQYMSHTSSYWNIRRAVAGNPGWYSFVDNNQTFPYGIADLPTIKEALPESFKMKLHLQLGTSDDGTGKNGTRPMRNTTEAAAQGDTRYGRGENFYNNAKEYAEENNLQFDWSYELVDHVNHVPEEMMPVAARYLYGSGERTSAIAEHIQAPPELVHHRRMLRGSF